MAAQFLQDFEKSGIHLPDKQRSRFVTLSDEIISLGRAFTTPYQSSDSSSARKAIALSYEELAEWNVSAARSTGIGRGEKVYLHPDSPEGQAIRREHPNAEIRKRFYTASFDSSGEKVEVLEELLKRRGELARLVGKNSWGDVALMDKMAKNPGETARSFSRFQAKVADPVCVMRKDNVMSFLTSLAERNRPQAARDLTKLSEVKRYHLSLPTGASTDIEGWDRDFYYSRAINHFFPSTPHTSQLSAYFSVGNCISGLSALFSRIYGIRFESEAVEPGEIWAPEVQKLAVIDEVEGKIGEIYCDLLAREGKPTGAAHFTVRCSRRVDDDDAEKDFLFMDARERDELREGGDDPQAGTPLQSEVKRELGRPGSYQLPVVVLSCDFEGQNGGGPPLLAWQEVETLFHEMGHAMHCKPFYRPQQQGIDACSYSDDWADRLSQCRWHALCNRFGRAAVDPDGALCVFLFGIGTLREAPQDWRAPANRALTPASEHHEGLCSNGDEQPDPDGNPGSKAAFASSARERL